ncbi:MAG: TIGR02270 family protein [Betaproteobacteria bacterium]|nr:TIGR02270 family protein [Betaproteobacteria bacterium]
MLNRRVIDQHAEEAGFLWGMRHQAVHAPHYNLADIAELDEAVEAHLDGLRVAGQTGRHAAMFLAPDAPENIFPLVVLAFGENGYNRDTLRDAFILGSLNAEALSALVSGLGWLDYATVAPVLPELMGAQVSFYRLVGIAASAIHRQDPGPLLEKLIGDPDDQVRARALRAAGELKRRDLAAQVFAHIKDDNEPCRFWVAWTSSLLRLPNALGALYPYLLDVVSPFNLHALHMGLRCAKPAQQAEWFDTLCNTPGLERQAVIAAGIIGDLEAMPWLIEQMQQPALAKYAGEAFSMMTGVDIYYDDLDLKEEEEEAALEDADNEEDEDSEDDDENDEDDDGEVPENDDEEMPDPDDETDLPVPDPGLIAAWWERHKHHYTIGKRYLAGEIIDANAAINVLRNGLQRQRKAAALELALLQPDWILFETRAPGKRQKRMLNP